MVNYGDANNINEEQPQNKTEQDNFVHIATEAIQSSEVYFAKYSFAGSSKQWNCPTGVLWNQGKKNVQLWKYTDNAIQPIKQMEVALKNEKAVIKIYVL